MVDKQYNFLNYLKNQLKNLKWRITTLRTGCSPINIICKYPLFYLIAYSFSVALVSQQTIINFYLIILKINYLKI